MYNSRKDRSKYIIGSIWEDCTAPSLVSGRGEARFELVLSLCTEIYIEHSLEKQTN